MVSIARSGLIHEWRRYLAAVLAVTFSGLLVVVQLALLLGMFATVSVAIDRSDADLWIGARNTPSVDLGRPLPYGADARAWAHGDVAGVERYVSVLGDLRRADGATMSVIINGIDTAPQGLAFSRLLSAEQRALLRDPHAVLVDPADLGKLRADVGSIIEINGRRARISGVVEGLRAIGGINALASFATLRHLAPDTANQTTFYLVKVKPGERVDTVAHDIGDTARVPRYSVWTSQDFSRQSQTYWLLESGAGIGSGFASALAMLVGLVITSQTLSGAILATIREFAALRALGVSLASLRSVVIEQALWVGVLGLLLTAVLTAGIAWLGDIARVAMSYPWWMLLSASLGLMAIAVGSGLLGLRPLSRAEPVSLLR